MACGVLLQLFQQGRTFSLATQQELTARGTEKCTQCCVWNRYPLQQIEPWQQQRQSRVRLIALV